MLMRRLAALCLLPLCACGAGPGADDPRDLGDFRLGYAIVQANDVEQGPFSRTATAGELTEALGTAVEARLARYDGDGLYHVGIAIGGYVLAQPGVPVVYTPKSVLIFEVNLYDNATRARLNAEPERIMAFEGITNLAPVVGSGLVRSREDQLANLAAEGARLVEAWLARNPDWFAPDPEAARVPFDRDDGRARAQAAIAAGSGS